MKQYFEMVGDKKVQYKFKPGEYEIYADIATTLWGGIPHDVNWATSLPIYQKTLKEYKK